MTDRSHFPASIRARVHDGAIDRVTRFFNATLADAFIEILQNSRSSGASRLDVVTEAVPEAEASGGIRVTVTDDGEEGRHGAVRPCAGPRTETRRSTPYQRADILNPIRSSGARSSFAASSRDPSSLSSKPSRRAPSSRQPSPNPIKCSGPLPSVTLSRRVLSTSRPNTRPALFASARRQLWLYSCSASVSPKPIAGVVV